MTRNDDKHPVVVVYCNGNLEAVIGFYTFREHGFYQSLVCKAENITMSDLNDCGDNLFKDEVSDKQWTRPEEAQNVSPELMALFNVEPSPEPVYTFHFEWLKMGMEEVDEYKSRSYHDPN